MLGRFLSATGSNIGGWGHKLDMPVEISEIHQLAERYGDENCQIIGRDCYIINFNSELTLFFYESTQALEAILNVDGIEKDLSSVYRSMNTFTEFCDWIHSKYCQENLEFDDPYLSDLDSQPSTSEMISTREITIYTWGNSIRKYKPEYCQMNFNAIPIVSLKRDAGMNLKKLNGMGHEIQQFLSEIPKFNFFISQIVAAIENNPSLESISINCKNGIHRSVAAAEILKREYYPYATIVHLELGH
jgi:hypothetical protein